MGEADLHIAAKLLERVDSMLATYERRSSAFVVPGTFSLLRDVRAALAAATEPPPDLTLSTCIAVIRRYRDGWDDVSEQQSWVRHINYATGDPPEREVEPMSAAERAVIEEIDRG